MLFAKPGRTLIVVAVLLTLILLGLAGCGADEPESIAPETPDVTEPADSEGDTDAQEPVADAERVLVESKCSGCHTLDRVWAASKDSAQWESTVRRMEANGLQISDDERVTIVAYLASQ
jgi:cytochrome c5